MDKTERDDTPKGRSEPSLMPGMVLLGVAAVLIVVVLINPDMPSWLRTTIATVAIAVVVALLAYATWVMVGLSRRGRK